MKTIIVSRDVWVKCFSLEYALTGSQGGEAVKESLAEKYGIKHWEKINFDDFRITFTDDEKMAYWVLKWA